MNSSPKNKASANPTKNFFVNMITRDISLEDSILDLLDNSVDSAWMRAGNHHMGLTDKTNLSRYSISITLSPTRFCITDNCGGMTLDDAIDHAFSFGRRGDPHGQYTIGVYGIGMKRAVFKIGRQIRVRSTVEDEDGTSLAFAVPIDVPKWVKRDDPPWDFDIEEDKALQECGVEVVVESLTTGAAASFGSPMFAAQLQRTIARDYALHLERGLNVKVNGTKVTGMGIRFLRSKEFKPMRATYKETANGNTVTVEIVGGMAAPPPDGPEPDDMTEGDKLFGWYVACNGRIVLAADKTTVSGWGLSDMDWPQWHPQYSGFLGMVFFSSPNPAALPLTTTKRSVDVTSEVFLRARPLMRDLTKQWTSYTNARKQSLEQAKKKEDRANAVSIGQVANRPKIKLPSLTSKSRTPIANVHYSVPVSRMKDLARALGRITMPYREVGLKSFNYTYDDFVGDD